MALFGRWNDFVFIVRNNVDHLLRRLAFLGLVIIRITHIDVIIFIRFRFIDLQRILAGVRFSVETRCSVPHRLGANLKF